MKIFTICSLFFLATISLNAQDMSMEFPYAESLNHPYGQLHPEAPRELADFALLIGTCDCKSISRIDQQHWADSVDMIWTWKYILNGMAVQDETLKVDGGHSGSIRQFIADSARWYVHYYSSNSPTTKLATWEGNKSDNGDIVLYKESAAPNGMEGFYRLTFSNISKKGYNWEGAWVDKNETIVYPTWRIFCRRNS